MIGSLQNRIIFMRWACCMFGILFFFKVGDSNNVRNVNIDLYEQGEQGMEESQEEVAHKIPIASIFIKIKNFVTRSLRHTTHIFEYRYQNPMVDILIPPPK
jgi:hypothetical protein